MDSTDARHALLGRLIDHAPTFPPASLPSAEALAEDARAVGSRHAWMLARLVWPASRLGEVAHGERTVSVVLDGPMDWDGAAPVEAVETHFGDDLATLRLTGGEVYVEVPVDEELEGRLDGLAERGLRAKVRCGGASVPSGADLARVVVGCRMRGLVFKATAGLHHAVRSNGAHGFLNLLAAVVFAGDEEAALAEVDPGAFVLDSAAFTWREPTADASELARARRDLFHSIGSCSFFEPVEELQALGVFAS
jgi:hypothetical protein